MGPEDGSVGEEFARMGRLGRGTTDIGVIVGQSERHTGRWARPCLVSTDVFPDPGQLVHLMGMISARNI